MLYTDLKENKNVRDWCFTSKEWKSLHGIRGWTRCHVLPFASASAKVASLYLRDLVEENLQGKQITVEDLDIDPATDSFGERAFIGSYVVKLWSLWQSWPEAEEKALNLVCCSPELTAISLLAAALEGVAIYCFSEAVRETLCLHGWGIPFLDSDKERWLLDLLEGISPKDRVFGSQWSSIVGRDKRTITGEILWWWLRRKADKRLEPPPSDS